MARDKRIISMKWLCIFAVLGILWFVPWVFAMHLGAVIYRPYEPDGVHRFFRVTGPLAANDKEVGWASKEKIPQSCRDTLVASEDMKFYDHFGIDPDGIEHAIERNQKKGKRKIGGSTITQQLVKNLFLSRDRSYIRKAREAVGAVLLNATMSKEDQMTWYFNVVEFGPNLYGIDAASRYYFKKPPQALSLSQCIGLVSLLPDPTRSSKYLKSGQTLTRLQNRYRRVLKSLRNMGTLPGSAIDRAQLELGV